MPHPKTPQRYPTQFFELAEQLAQAHAPIKLQFPLRSRAHNYRQRYSSFRRVCEQSGIEECPLLSLQAFQALLASRIKLEPVYAPKDEKLHSLEPATLIFETFDMTTAEEFTVELPTAPQAAEQPKPVLTPVALPKKPFDPFEDMLEKQLRLSDKKPIERQEGEPCRHCPIPLSAPNPMCEGPHSQEIS